MRRHLILIVALLALACARSQAQVRYSLVTLLAGGTNNVGAPATNSYSLPINCTAQTEVPLLFKLTCSGTNSYNVGFFLSRSVDGTNWDSSTAPIQIPVAANGTNSVLLSTNLVVGAMGWLRLDTVANTNDASYVTNLVVVYGIKRGS